MNFIFLYFCGSSDLLNINIYIIIHNCLKPLLFKTSDWKYFSNAGGVVSRESDVPVPVESDVPLVREVKGGVPVVSRESSDVPSSFRGVNGEYPKYP